MYYAVILCAVERMFTSFVFLQKVGNFIFQVVLSFNLATSMLDGWQLSP